MALPPGGPMDICFSFDTTGSMSSSIQEVKGKVQDMIQRLQADIPGINIAVFAHGDYCDRSNYITKYIDFSTNVKALCQWIKKVKSTSGGDSDECYELVLHEVQELSWRPGSQRALIMIGDALPHEPSYPDNTLKLDWRKEADKLANMGVKIYSVQVTNWSTAETTAFYQNIADRTGGCRVELKDFSNTFDFIMAICYCERGAEFLDVYEKEVRARNKGKAIKNDLDKMFGTLRKEASTSSTSGIVPPSLTKTVSLKKVPTLTKKVSLKKVPTLPTSTKKAAVVKPTAKLGKPMKKKVLSKPKATKKEEKSTKLKRENVPETRFSLRKKKWSRWVCCLYWEAPKYASNGENNLWEARKAGKGYRRRTIFGGKMSKPALYEAAVQICPGGKRFVLYNKFSAGFTSANWEQSLLGGKDIRAQVDKLIDKKCKIFLRRIPLTKKGSNKVAEMVKMYDYAWSKVPRQRKVYRRVAKSGMIISSDD